MKTKQQKYSLSRSGYIIGFVFMVAVLRVFSFKGSSCNFYVLHKLGSVCVYEPHFVVVRDNLTIIGWGFFYGVFVIAFSPFFCSSRLAENPKASNDNDHCESFTQGIVKSGGNNFTVLTPDLKGVTTL